MKVKFDKVEKEILEIIQGIGRLAQEMGLKAYVVGGFVRDCLLRRKPNWDVDIVIDGDAIRLAEQLAKTQMASLTVFRQFRTATLGYESGLRVDLASARKEAYPRLGSLPVVDRGEMRDDLFRRDFTINAMAVNINPSGFGELVDFFDGLADLRTKQIRVLHKNSFVDDPTRILRAVRFEQRFDFAIERSTLTWLKTAITNNFFKTVTPPRYFAEFRKILKEDNPVKAIVRLQRLKGLGFIHRSYGAGIVLLKQIAKNIQSLRKDLFYKSKNWSTVYLLALLGQETSKTIQELATRFHLTKEEREGLLAVQEGSWVSKIKSKRLSPSAVYQVFRKLPKEVVYLSRVQYKDNQVGQYADDFLKLFSRVQVSISGEDLKQMGATTGPLIGQILEKILLRKLDGHLVTRQEELQEAQQLVRAMN